MRPIGLPEIPVEDVSSRRSSPRLKATRDKIREQENAVLDVFSQESFFKVIQTQLYHQQAVSPPCNVCMVPLRILLKLTFTL